MYLAFAVPARYRDKKIRLRSTDNQDLMSMMKLQESLAKIETQIENIVRHYLL